jgi:hypothetical protein
MASFDIKSKLDKHELTNLVLNTKSFALFEKLFNLRLLINRYMGFIWRFTINRTPDMPIFYTHQIINA